MKKLRFAVSLLAAAAMLAGCGSGSAGPAPSSAAISDAVAPVASAPAIQPCTISEDIQLSECSQDQLDAFNSSNQYGITVENMNIASNDDATLVTRIAAGTAPDIIRCNAALDVPQFATQHILIPLDSYIATAADQFPPDDFMSAQDNMKFDGTTVGKGATYALSKDMSYVTNIWVNKADFTAAGLPVPSSGESLTWDQLFDYANRLVQKDENGSITHWGFMSNLTGGDLYSLANIMCADQGVSFFSADNKTADFSNPVITQVINTIFDNAKTGAISSPLYPAPGWGGDTFQNGKVSMYMTGYWFYGMISADDNAANYIMIPSPHYDGQTGPTAYVQGPTGAGIWTGSKNQDAAWEFMAYFFGQKNQPAHDRATSGWGQSVYKSMQSLMPSDSPMAQSAIQAVNFDTPNAGPNPNINPYCCTTPMVSFWEQDITPVLMGSASLSDALGALTNDVNNQIQEGLSIVGS